MSWAGAGKRGAADEDADSDGPGPDGVLATPGVREPALQTRVVEVPLAPDDNAVAVSPCGRYIAVDAPCRVGVLDLHQESRTDLPKTSAGRHVYAFAEYPGGIPVLVVAETTVAAPSTTLEVPSVAETTLHFVSGPDWSGSETRPFTLPGEIALLEGGRGGLVALTLRGTIGAMVLRLLDGDGGVDFEGGSIPDGVVQLIRDDGGHRIDAVVVEPTRVPALPGLPLAEAATNRFYVLSGKPGGFRPAPAGVEAAVVSRVVGSLAASAAEVFQVPGSTSSFISLGLGRPILDYGLSVGAVLWRSPLELLLVVTDDIVPMLVPVCRGSGTVGAAIFPDKAPLVKRLSYVECPVATAAGSVLLCGGRAYMVVA